MKICPIEAQPSISSGIIPRYIILPENELEQKIFEVMCQASEIKVKQTKGQKKIKFKLKFDRENLNQHLAEVRSS